MGFNFFKCIYLLNLTGINCYKECTQLLSLSVSLSTNIQKSHPTPIHCVDVNCCYDLYAGLSWSSCDRELIACITISPVQSDSMDSTVSWDLVCVSALFHRDMLPSLLRFLEATQNRRSWTPCSYIHRWNL